MNVDGSHDIDFIRECVARNPGGYTSEFRFLLSLVDASSRREHQPGEGHTYETTCTVCGRPGMVNLTIVPRYPEELPA